VDKFDHASSLQIKQYYPILKYKGLCGGRSLVNVGSLNLRDCGEMSVAYA
jgi:hypothetical protein